MNQHKPKLHPGRSILCLLLAVCLVAALLPALPETAQAASSDDAIQTSIDKLVGWGIMRGDTDGGMYPDRPLMRCEYAALINRAFGFTQTGPTPFTDVPADAWYADDIGIAYNAGFYNGTSETTANPSGILTREQALVLIGRNLRLEEIPGQVIELSDGDEFSDFASGYARAAAQAGLIDDDDGEGFRPTDQITRGEMSELLCRAMGNLVQTAGEQTLGDIFGNVTINVPGVALKDTVIAGDLYVGGGVGLGGLELENVTVMGRIVVAGGGQAEDGSESIVLRNVEAESLVLDSPTGQYTSIRVEGDTSIAGTSLRTGAYVLDRTESGYGLLSVSLEGDGASYTVAGNLEEVINRAPGSTLTVGNGNTAILTIDETAVGSTLSLDSDATVGQLNLDTSVAVTGTGDVQDLIVNAADSSIETLPDSVTVRPGLTAEVAGEEMDPQTASESSVDPRILAGYPRVKDVAPTSLTAVFSTNKAGTIYWAISTVVDGSLTDEELLEPPAYGSKPLQHGTVAVTASNTETTVAIKNLSVGGTYYLSAVLVDARGIHSAVKVTSFSTPDNTVPAFASGYPTMTRIGTAANRSQVAVMATKSCVLYYVLFPSGSSSPKTDDFKTGNLAGNLGSGNMDLTRNVAEYINVNRVALEEVKSYDLYLWLTDADGGQSSAVKKLTFTTPDETPPIFNVEFNTTKVQATSISGTVNVNEAGTVYWVAVTAGSEYPKPKAGESGPVALSSDYAKLQVANGMNGLKSGSVSVKANTDATITISGLTSERSYDIYYLAKDSAGNYSEVVKVAADVHTLDNTAPTADRRFSDYEGDNTDSPYAYSDVEVVFSETVMTTQGNLRLMDLYDAVLDAYPDNFEERSALASAIRGCVTLYVMNGTRPVLAQEREYNSDGTLVNPDDTDWVVDYYNVEVEMDPTDTEGRKMVVRFPGGSDPSDEYAALNLKSGTTYTFRLTNIADTSDNRNQMGAQYLKQFTTLSAQAYLDSLNLTNDIPIGGEYLSVKYIDMAFTMTPDAVSSVEDNINYDILLLSNAILTFDLYYLEPGATEWEKTDNSGRVTSLDGGYYGTSLYRTLISGNYTNPQLNSLNDDEVWQFVINITSLNGSTDRDSWSADVPFHIQVVTGSSTVLGNQAAKISQSSTLLDGVTVISNPSTLELTKTFTDTTAPVNQPGYPQFDISSKTGTMSVNLNRAGTVYYVVAPVGTITTRGPTPSSALVTYDTDGIPHMEAGALTPRDSVFELTEPTQNDLLIRDYDTSTTGIIVGKPLSVSPGKYDIALNNLIPNTQYFVYMIFQGTGTNAISPNVMLYKFTTEEEAPFTLEVDLVSNPSMGLTASHDCLVDYLLVRNTSSALGTYLTDLMVNHCTTEGRTFLYANGYQSYNIQKAMNTPVVVNNVTVGSVFDYCATDAYKSTLASYIGSTQEGTSANIAGAAHNVSLSADERAVVNCAAIYDLPTGAEYVIVAVGKMTNTDGTVTYAFSSNSPLLNPDLSPPQVISVSQTSIPATASATTIGIGFDEALYYLKSSGTGSVSDIILIDSAPIPRSDSSSISIGSLVDYQGYGVDVVLNGTVGRSIETIQLSFTPALAGSGTSISFKSPICDEEGNPQNLALWINFTLNSATNAYDVTISPASWDGR